MKKLALLSFALLFIVGCSSAPFDINRFDPQDDQALTRVVLKGGEKYLAYESMAIDISVALFEYNNIIVMPLMIENKTDQTIPAKDYSLSLSDGRDRKPIKLVSRDDLAKFRAGMSGGGSANIPLENQAVQAAFSAIEGVIRPSEKSAILKGVDIAINDYFQFRPIWAREKRQGILCFLVDFKLEYPLTLEFKLKGKPIDLRFMPETKAES
jgi:hypothetical protein